MAEAITIIGLLAAIPQIIKYILEFSGGLSSVSTSVRSATRSIQQWECQLQASLILIDELETHHGPSDNHTRKIMTLFKEEADMVKTLLQDLKMSRGDGKVARLGKTMKLIKRKTDMNQRMLKIDQLSEILHRRSILTKFRQLEDNLNRKNGIHVPYRGNTSRSQTLLPWTNVNVRGGLQQIMSTLPESMLTPAIIIISELSCCGSQDISTRQLTSLVDVYQPVGIIEFFTSHGIITSGISPDSVHIEPMTSTMVRRELKCMRIFPIHLESFLHLVDSKWTRDLNDFNAVQQDSSYFFHAISGLNALTELCTEDQILRSGLNVAVSMTIRIVRLLTEMGLHVRAKHMMQKILEWGPEFFSSDRIAHTAVRRRLAVVERYIGRFQAAESIEYDVIELDLKALGESGVVSMCSLNNYALTLQSQGKFAKSERAHLIALSKKEERLGRDHPDTLMSVSDLGQCLQHLGQHISAESLIRRALSGRQILFTPTHPAILRSMNKLGLRYLSQNRYEEAENMHRLCLFRREELLGLDHLDTIRSKSNLAIALTHRGNPKEAERLLRDVMVDFNSLLGPDQPEAIKAYQNLGRFLRDQKRYREAEKIFQVCRSRAELSLGCAHPRTVDTWRELAIVLHWQEKYFKALKFAIRVRDVQIKLFGYDNSATCDSIQHVEQLRPLL